MISIGAAAQREGQQVAGVRDVGRRHPEGTAAVGRAHLDHAREQVVLLGSSLSSTWFRSTAK